MGTKHTGKLIQVSHNILLIRKIGILILLRTNPTLYMYSSGGENAELGSGQVHMRSKGFLFMTMSLVHRKKLFSVSWIMKHSPQFNVFLQ